MTKTDILRSAKTRKYDLLFAICNFCCAAKERIRNMCIHQQRQVTFALVCIL